MLNLLRVLGATKRDEYVRRFVLVLSARVGRREVDFERIV